MEKRIELEKRARKANQITELNLDNCRSTSIVGLTDEYTALESLSLINVGLTTLKGFPKLPNLKKLELSDNRISNGLNYLTTSPKLQYLNLSGNKIKDLETLKPLEEFKNLAVLDLFNNEATQIENYREKIFEMLPSLKFLDGFDCNDVEAASDGDDDDEVNGNDSDDDDKQKAFCLSNGLEIDLDELEALERRVQAKKNSAAALVAATPTQTENPSPVSPPSTIYPIDELDEYLKELKLRDALDQQDKMTVATTIAARNSATTTTTNQPNNTNNNNLHFTILLYWLLAILNLANAAYFTVSDGIPEDDDVDDSDEDDSDDEEDNGDVSLAEVYNDDLEEDNSEWDEEDGVGADEDDSDDSDEDEAADGDAANKSVATDDKKAAAAAAAGAEEAESRGKKRKHDG